MKQLYWDEGNGEVTTDSEFAPIYDSGHIYIETYEVFNHGGDKLYSIVYTQDMKDGLDLELYKDCVINGAGYKRSDLGRLLRLGVPSDKYKALKEGKA